MIERQLPIAIAIIIMLGMSLIAMYKLAYDPSCLQQIPGHAPQEDEDDDEERKRNKADI